MFACSVLLSHALFSVQDQTEDENGNKLELFFCSLDSFTIIASVNIPWFIWIVIVVVAVFLILLIGCTAYFTIYNIKV